MSVKIQINSLEALERLIGGDNELEVELRNSIVQDFAKRHLKGLTTEDTIQKAKREVENTVEKETKTFFSNTGWYSSSMVLSDQAKNIIRTFVEVEINKVVETRVREYIESATGVGLKATIEKSAEKLATDLVSKATDQRINQLADLKIKEKLGIK